jgi:hypothetical protein
MTQEEYNSKLNELEVEFRNKKRLLIKECALSNNPYKVGDIVKDSIGSLKIEKITVELSYLSSLPECVYWGVELKVDLNPMKRQTGRCVYQNNIKS